jgi:Domain of unknown function (DUF4265)
MNVSDKHVKVFFKLEQDGDGYPPADCESLWAVDLGDNTYQIDNIPFYVVGLSSNDIVTAQISSGQLEFSKILVQSDHSTLRVVVFEKSLTDTLREQFKKIGCDTEAHGAANLLAVDIPSTVNYKKVSEILSMYVDIGKIDFEESALRHFD